jgi:phosphate transport system permease protein
MQGQQAMEQARSGVLDAAVSPRERARFAARRGVNLLMAGLVGLAALIGCAVLLFILGYVLVQGWAALSPTFFTASSAPIEMVNGKEVAGTGGGVLMSILGSVLILALASLLSIPLGLLAGMYLSEYGRGKFAFILRYVADVMTGIPSIVTGVVVWSLVVITFGHFSAWAGALALSIIMVPIITRTVEEVLRLVPNALREASLALGVPQWRTIVRVVLPSAASGVITGIVLAVARAGGETAPLLLTVLGNEAVNWDPNQPTDALPLRIFTYATQPSNIRIQQAWGASFILIMVILVFSLLTRIATRGKKVG